MSGSSPTASLTYKHLALPGLHLHEGDLGPKSELGRCAVHITVKNLFSTLVCVFPKAQFRSVILKDIQVTLLLIHLQTVSLSLEIVLASCFCNSFSISDHQNILDLDF